MTEGKTCGAFECDPEGVANTSGLRVERNGVTKPIYRRRRGYRRHW